MAVGFPKDLTEVMSSNKVATDSGFVTDATPELKIHPVANMFLAYSVVDGN